MLRFLVLSSAVCLATASGYGGIGGGYGGGHGGLIGLEGGAMGGYGGGLGYGAVGGYGGHAVPAAVLSHHDVKFYDVPSTGHIIPTTIDVPANILPVNFVFRSSSSHVNVVSKHEGASGSFKETHSQDEPHVLKHSVTKPIIQEVYEVITPFRRITQTVEPVREEIATLVARGVGNGGAAAGAGGLGAGGAGGFGAGAGALGAGLGGGFGLGAGGAGGLGAGHGGLGGGDGGYGLRLGAKGGKGY